LHEFSGCLRVFPATTTVGDVNELKDSPDSAPFVTDAQNPHLFFRDAAGFGGRR
jgi:hypothetical protein